MEVEGLEKKAECETRAEHMLNECRHEGKNNWGMPNPTEVNGNFISSFMELGLHTQIKILLDRNKDRHPLPAWEPCMGMPLLR